MLPSSASRLDRVHPLPVAAIKKQQDADLP
jgi:hypothetical protein